MTMTQDLRQAALLQARDALKKLIDFAGEVHQGEWFGPSGRRDNAVAVGEAALAHLAAADSEGVSGSDVPARPTSLADLHAAMMNLAADKATLAKMDGSPKGFYLLGFRDARHAAAELALSASPPLPLEQGAVPQTIFKVYHDEEWVGTFLQASFSTREKAEAYIEWCKTDADRGPLFAEECSIQEEVLDSHLPAPPVADPRQAQMGETKWANKAQ